ncbi:MAG: RNA 2'-phosphotransferase [Candidatus Thermoplasmatota archaeon]|jgi:putative RNA 2'-phosphotransferase|nr:RNA 2'-phosphotransferase [Candidatus Thermoplasmatota archaeon]
MPGNEIRKCYAHGYFRGEECPNCGEPGKFMLSDQEVDLLGRIITGVLRHKPEKYHIEVSEKGYVNIDELVQEIRFHYRRLHFVGPSHIFAIVLTDTKGRYQISDNKRYVRATYGHTLEVDLSDLPTDGVPDTLYYPTNSEEFEIFKENGILPSDRRWIHLSSSKEKAYIAGLHHFDSPLLIPISTLTVKENGETIYRAGVGVFICKFVPPVAVQGYEEYSADLDEETLKEIRISRERKMSMIDKGW